MRQYISNLRNHYAFLYKIFLFIIAIVLLVLMFPHEGKFKYEFQKGKPWQNDDMIAPFDFAILKTESQINKEKKNILANHHPYFRLDTTIYNKKIVELKDIFNKNWTRYYGNTIENKSNNYALCLSIADSLLEKGIIELNPVIEGMSHDFEVFLIKGNVAQKNQLGNFFTIQTADEYINKKVGEAPANLGIHTVFLVQTIENALVQNVIYDTETTEREKKSLLNNLSLTNGMVQKGERIIAKGELINSEKYQILQSLKTEYETRLGTSQKYLFILAGQIILVSISILVFVLFLYSFRRDIFADNKKISLMLLVIFLMVMITSVIVKNFIEFLYLVPLCLVPIIIRIFFDTRLALFVYLVTIIIIGFLVPNSFEFLFIELVTGIVTIISIVKLQRRAQFFLTSFFIFISYSAIYIGMDLIQEGNLESLKLWDFILFGGSATLTLFSYPLIFIFEKLFGFITDINLMEISDTNTKLLRELALKTPGTFQHSLQVANLAEACVQEIGGNTLLVRTGALYHDIGKIDMPMYFIENQVTGFNPHDELYPEESGVIIISHVLMGVEKARSYKLPEQIIDFIRTHHGTRCTEFFYNKQIQLFPGEEVNPQPFTYKGPIPFSKETSVLMMADSVEAASRAMKNPDEHSLSELVERVINKQIENGQFANSNITLRDIQTIKKVLKRKLMNIFHVRVPYPEVVLHT